MFSLKNLARKGLTKIVISMSKDKAQPTYLFYNKNFQSVFLEPCGNIL